MKDTCAAPAYTILGIVLGVVFAPFINMIPGWISISSVGIYLILNAYVALGWTTLAEGIRFLTNVGITGFTYLMWLAITICILSVKPPIVLAAILIAGVGVLMLIITQVGLRAINQYLKANFQ